MVGRLDGRNGAIWRAYLNGNTQEAIAEEHGITQERVSVIISQVRASIPEQVKEQLFQREMDFLDMLRARMARHIEEDLPPAFNQKGQILIDHEGRIVRDGSARMAAVDRAVKLHERIAKLTGLDAPTKADIVVTEVAQSAAQKRAAEAVARLSEGEEES